jgi:hypothetical protein
MSGQSVHFTTTAFPILRRQCHGASEDVTEPFIQSVISPEQFVIPARPESFLEKEGFPTRGACPGLSGACGNDSRLVSLCITSVPVSGAQAEACDYKATPERAPLKGAAHHISGE